MPWRDCVVGSVAGAGLSFTATMVLLQRYLSSELKRPELIHAPMHDREEIDDRHLLQEVKLLLRDYWPHPILEFSGYVSTFSSLSAAVLPVPRVTGECEELRMSDGGTVSLQWSEIPLLSGEHRIVLVLPGLSNDSRTSFIQDAMRHFRAEGLHPVTLNYRGTAGLEYTSRKFGCADSWLDLNEVLDHIEAKYPGAILFGVGFSMGGALLLRYLGQEGLRARLKAAVCIAAPVDLVGVGKSLESSWRKRVTNFIMVNGVKMFMMSKVFHSNLFGTLDRGQILRATSLRYLEEATICRIHGYRDADEYYSLNSPLPVLRNIAVPTLLVHAQDDPVVSVSTIPIEEVKRNPRIYLIITRRGGHIGWGSGGLGGPAWTDNMAVDFMQTCAIRSRL